MLGKLLGFAPWWAWLVGAAALAAIGAAGGYKAGRYVGALDLAHEQRDREAEKAAAATISGEWQRKARAADARERELERMLTDIARSIDRDGFQTAEKLRAAVGRADAAAVGLSAQLGAVVADATRAAEASASAADARERQAAAEAARVLADVLRRCSARVSAVAGYADSAAAAGERCERWGDAVAADLPASTRSISGASTRAESSATSP
jgi:hypothetical protein